MKSIKAVIALSSLAAFSSFAAQETFDSLLEQGYELQVASLDGGTSSTIHIYLQSPDKATVYVCEADDNFHNQIKICDQAISE